MRDFRIILWYLMANGLTLEWVVVGGRTYQIAGRKGMEGYWERLFHDNSHPTRRSVGNEEIERAFNSGRLFVLYCLEKDEEGALELTREELLAKIEQFFPGSIK